MKTQQPTGCDFDHQSSIESIAEEYRVGDPIIVFHRPVGQELNELPNIVLCCTGREALEVIVNLMHHCKVDLRDIILQLMKQKLQDEKPASEVDQEICEIHLNYI